MTAYEPMTATKREERVSVSGSEKSLNGTASNFVKHFIETLIEFSCFFLDTLKLFTDLSFTNSLFFSSYHVFTSSRSFIMFSQKT